VIAINDRCRSDYIQLHEMALAETPSDGEFMGLSAEDIVRSDRRHDWYGFMPID